MIIHLSSLKTDYEIIAHSHASDRPPHHSKLVKNTEKIFLYLSSLKMDYEKISYSHVSDRLPHRSKLVKNTEKTLISVVVGLKSFNIFDNEFSLTGFIRSLMRSTFQSMVLNVLFDSKQELNACTMIIGKLKWFNKCKNFKNYKVRSVNLIANSIFILNSARLE